MGSRTMGNWRDAGGSELRGGELGEWREEGAGGGGWSGRVENWGRKMDSWNMGVAGEIEPES